MQKLPEFVVHERMSQGEEMKGTKVNREVKGWSAGEMKGKPSGSLEEDTGEMIEWRSMSQDEMNQCWRKLVGRMEEEVLDKYEAQDSKREDCWARIFALLREYNLQ